MSKRVEEAIERFGSGGVFLTAGDNVMTVGWGQFGIMWGKQVFVAAIRPSRYTDSLVQQTKQFTLSVPAMGELSGELAFVGTKSGRELDKWSACCLTKQKAKSVDTFVVEGCKHYFECKVLTKLPLKQEEIPSLDLRWYPTGDDYHNLYIAEIVESYGN
ncbi:MAG: flavin reductase family protein [Clostridia bacterium]|nr:flavin reductase family protein [Clostridia bacterium]